MNYQNYSGYHNYPPQFGSPQYGIENGITPITRDNMTISDMYRSPFLLFQENQMINKTTPSKDFFKLGKLALKNIEFSELEKLFFSDDNVKRVQKLIKRDIYYRTKGQFKLDVDLDQNELFLAMRAVYMEFARFMTNEDIVREVKRLNQKVIDESVPGIITNIRQDYGYLQEINKPLSPIPRPINVNNAGRRTLPSVTSVLSMRN